MPVQQTRGHAGKALLIAGVSVVLLLGLAFVVARLASRGDVEVHLGDPIFDAGKVSNIAERIDDDGGLPILYPDLTNRDRDIYVQHTGDRKRQGWSAFSAFDPADPSCKVTLDRAAKQLVNECTRATYPLDGTGLRFYPVSVDDDGRLQVDLNGLTTSTTSSAPPSTAAATSASAPASPGAP
jgi:hypothetical protein